VNVIDWAVSLVVTIAVAGGVRRGLVAQVSATASIAGALYAAKALAPPLAAKWGIDRYVAYLVVFGPSAIALGICARRLGRRIRAGPLAPLDRALGGALGAAKGVLVCYFLLYVVLCFPAGPPLSRPLARAFEALSAAFKRSVAAPLLLRGMDRADALFPPELRVRLDEKGARGLAATRGTAREARPPEPRGRRPFR
jgi:membrane protein required for colicin V production